MPWLEELHRGAKKLRLLVVLLLSINSFIHGREYIVGLCVVGRKIVIESKCLDDSKIRGVGEKRNNVLLVVAFGW